MSLKSLSRAITPPLLWKAGGAVYHRFGSNSSSKWKYGIEQPAAFYDESFRAAEHWHHHYTKSRYYSLWAIIADRVCNSGSISVLDIGCGPGQVACLLRDKGLKKYVGLDFSPARISQAHRVCPEYEFVVANIFESDLIETSQYDCLLLMEFLEHVKDDTSVIARIRPETRVLATVPNFPATGHVRHFADIAEVQARYAGEFEKIQIDQHLENEHGKKYYLIEAVK